MVNYYELLEISSSAGEEEIRAAIKKARRTWNARSSNPNAEIRAEAEQRVRDIMEAEKVLLDQNQRSSYDFQLSQAPIIQGNDNDDDDYEDWISLAVEYDERKDYNSLADLMRQVTQKEPDNPRAWLWRGLSSEYQEQYADAEYEIKKAISLAPDAPIPHALLAELYADRDEFQLAKNEFERASALNPDDYDLKMSVAECYRLLHEYSEALSRATVAYEHDKTNERAQYIYALALYDHTMQSVSYNRSFNDYVVTNQAQLSYLKTKESIFASLPSGNEKVSEIKNKFYQKIREAEAQEFRSSDRNATYIVAGVIGVLLMVSGSGIIPGIAIIGGTIGLYYYRHNMPGWKWQQKQASEETKRSGLQG